MAETQPLIECTSSMVTHWEGGQTVLYRIGFCSGLRIFYAIVGSHEVDITQTSYTERPVFDMAFYSFVYIWFPLKILPAKFLYLLLMSLQMAIHYLNISSNTGFYKIFASCIGSPWQGDSRAWPIHRQHSQSGRLWDNRNHWYYRQSMTIGDQSVPIFQDEEYCLCACKCPCMWA